VLFGSCAKNVRKKLEGHSMALLEGLGTALAAESVRSSVLIFEDEQLGKAAEAEGTRALLRGWAARNRHVRVVLAQPLRYPAWSRTQRLALCRNVLLGEALATLPPSGVLVQFDLDCQVPAPTTLLGALRSMIGPAPAWDVVTSNSPAGQFWCAA
jgi:hypothetical protein